MENEIEKKEKPPTVHLPSTTIASQDLIDRAKLQSYNFMNPERWAIMNTVARAFYDSGALPKSIDNAAKAIMVIQAGYECGLQPIEAINSFYFVNGKLSLYGEMGIALVRRAGHKITWGACDDKEATVTITRCDTGEALTQKFTFEMAMKRGLTSKGGPWISAPDNMLKYKAFWATARFLVPDALHGHQMKEEMEEIITDNGVEQSKKTDRLKKDATVTDVKTEEESLQAALDKKEEEPVAEKKEVKKTAKTSKKEATEPGEAAKVEDKKPTEPETPAAKAMRQGKEEAERYARLIDQELNGTALTSEEKSFLTEYQNKHK